MLVNPQKDPMGQAISDYHNHRPLSKLITETNMSEPEEFPIAHLFRTFENMPELEQQAMQLAKGRILDVGAGAGAHSLHLKNKGFDVTAIDTSALSVEVMSQRGVNAQHIDFFDLKGENQFDTLLFMMNGVGLCETIEGLPRFFEQCKKLLAPGGQILLDSSNIIYLFVDEDGRIVLDLNSDYYGQLTYHTRYGKLHGEPFKWLFIDFDTLADAALDNGFYCTMEKEGEHYDYLARLIAM